MSTTTEATSGRQIPAFPLLSMMTRGLAGLWIIGGAPKAGKTTLATNLVASVAGPQFPCLYLDMENGYTPDARCVGERIRDLAGADALALEYTRAYRTLGALLADLACVPAPALIVVDHIQEFAEGEDSGPRRAAIDARLKEFKALKLAGYSVVLLSQFNRGSYHRRPTKADFKESGAIEAVADAALGIWKRSEFAPPRVTALALRDAPPPQAEIQLQQTGRTLTEGDLLPLRAAGKVVSAALKVSCPVLRAVAKAAEGLTRVEVMKASGLSRAQAGKLLRGHREARRLTLSDGGVYTLGPMRELPATG